MAVRGMDIGGDSLGVGPFNSIAAQAPQQGRRRAAIGRL
jgi:hypothetical protein